MLALIAISRSSLRFYQLLHLLPFLPLYDDRERLHRIRAQVISGMICRKLMRRRKMPQIVPLPEQVASDSYSSQIIA